VRAALAVTSDACVTARRAQLETALREISEHLPRLSPQCNVADAVLVFDDMTIGMLPLSEPHVLPTDVARIEVRAPGYRSAQRAISVPEATVFRELFTLVRDTPAAVVAPPTVPLPTATMPPPAAVRGAPSRFPYRAVGLAGVIGEVILEGVGALGFALRNGAATSFNEAREDCYVSGDSVRMVALQGMCQSTYDLAQTYQTLGIAGFVADGVLAAGGVVPLCAGGSGDASRTSSRAPLRCGVHVGAVGVTCAGVL
jgi:hypothetical protein